MKQPCDCQRRSFLKGSGITCDVTMDGANAQQCVVRLPAPETVAAGSLIDVSMVATDDNLSAIDAECRVFVTF